MKIKDSIKRDTLYTALGDGGSVAIVCRTPSGRYKVMYFEQTRYGWEQFPSEYVKNLKAAKKRARKLT